MKALEQEIHKHLGSEVTTICRCWIIERSDGSKIGFTDHDQDIFLEGVSCERDAGAEPSGVEERIGLNINSAEVSGALQSEYIKADDIHAGLYDNARVKIFIVNWSAPSQYFLDHVYLVGNITQEDGLYRMELRGLLSQLDQTQGKHFIKRCQADLGDERCRVSLEESQFSAIGSISQTSSSLLFTVTGLDSYDAGWFRSGRLTWTQGANVGKSVQVTEHSKITSAVILQLWEPQSAQVSIGDKFRILTGCDKLFSTCKQKFSNTNNFRGFPHMPGNQIILSNSSNSDNFDGGPIVP